MKTITGSFNLLNYIIISDIFSPSVIVFCFDKQKLRAYN